MRKVDRPAESSSVVTAVPKRSRFGPAPTSLQCRCEACGALFITLPSVRAIGKGRFCSKRCGNSRWRGRLDFRHPELAELVELLYPFMHTQELAEFLGLQFNCVHYYAFQNRILKDDAWLRSRGRPAYPWPTDPELREVYGLNLALKRMITIRGRRLARE